MDSSVSGVDAAPVLADVVAALGGHLVHLVAAPQGTEVPVTGPTLVEPDEVPALQPGQIALVIGARGGAARPLVAAAGRAGAAAVLLRAGARSQLGPLAEAAEAAGVAVLAIAPDTGWDQVHALLTELVAGAARSPGPDDASELFALARTLLTMTGGSVSVEDAAHRVLAYAAVPGEADELRVQSILGRQGPESHLALLRGMGVYDDLRHPGRVVQVPARPDLGWRPRLATGIFAGERLLGTLWLQEGSLPLAAGAAEALLGTARLLAVELAGEAAASPRAVQARRALLADALQGHVLTPAARAELGLRRTGSAVLVAVTARDPEPDPGRSLPGGTRGRARPDVTAQDRTPAADDVALVRGRMANRVAVWAAGYHAGATAVLLGSTVLVLLPGADAGIEPALAAEVRRLSADLGVTVQAGFCSLDLAAEQLPDGRHRLDRLAGYLAGHPQVPVASFERLRAHLQLDRAVELARDAGLLAHPGLDRLRRPGGDWNEHARALHAWLEAGGDVNAAAGGLHVHPNTVRYRLRRACDLAGLDLADPDHRLLAQLALRTAVTPSG